MTILREIRPEENIAARELILDILNQEYKMSLTLEELPDIKDIHKTYRSSEDGNYWVALEGDRIVGSIGILKLHGNDYELRRMYTHADYRGRGIAQKLVDLLLQWCEGRDVAAIYLETNERWKAAHHIYEKYGFEPVTQDDLPSNFPVVRVATGFYRRIIKAPNQSFQRAPVPPKPRAQCG